MATPPPSVNVTFTFQAGESKTTHEITVADTEAVDINEVAPDAVSSNTSFGYSGRHDHGALPTLKCDPKHARLVASIQDAKKACDEFLTQALEQQVGGGGGGPPVEKKPRIDETC